MSSNSFIILFCFANKQQELELLTSKPNAENQQLTDNSTPDSKQLSIAQLVYSENKVRLTSLIRQLMIELFVYQTKTMKIHTMFDKLGPKIEFVSII